MQQTMFALEDEELRELAHLLEAEQQQQLIELMAQAIHAVLQHAHDGENHDRS